MELFWKYTTKLSGVFRYNGSIQRTCLLAGVATVLNSLYYSMHFLRSVSQDFTQDLNVVCVYVYLKNEEFY